jgi:transposase, IS6 family
MILNALVEKLKHRAKDDFKGRHFEASLILQAVSWSLRSPLSSRDIEELFREWGLAVDHSTLNRWVLAYAPLIEKRLRHFHKPHCGSVRIDETYVRIRGEWRYLYRALDKHGNPVDFLLTAKRDLEAAKRFFRKALQDQPLLSPDRIGTDGVGPYPPAITATRKAGLLARTPVHYVTRHLQQGIESDHFRVKKNMPGSAAFSRSPRRGAPFRASKPCCGCARALALRVCERCASRTSCLRSASASRGLTKSKKGPVWPILWPTPEFATGSAKTIWLAKAMMRAPILSSISQATPTAAMRVRGRAAPVAGSWYRLTMDDVRPSAVHGAGGQKNRRLDQNLTVPPEYLK